MSFRYTDSKSLVEIVSNMPPEEVEFMFVQANELPKSAKDIFEDCLSEYCPIFPGQRKKAIAAAYLATKDFMSCQAKNSRLLTKFRELGKASKEEVSRILRFATSLNPQERQRLSYLYTSYLCNPEVREALGVPINRINSSDISVRRIVKAAAYLTYAAKERSYSEQPELTNQTA